MSGFCVFQFDSSSRRARSVQICTNLQPDYYMKYYRMQFVATASSMSRAAIARGSASASNAGDRDSDPDLCVQAPWDTYADDVHIRAGQQFLDVADALSTPKADAISRARSGLASATATRRVLGKSATALAWKGAMTPHPMMPNSYIRLLMGWPCLELDRESAPIAMARRGRSGAALRPCPCRGAGAPARSRPLCAASARRWAGVEVEIPTVEARTRLRPAPPGGPAGARAPRPAPLRTL